MNLRYGTASLAIEQPPGLLGVLQPMAITTKPLDIQLQESCLRPIGKPTLRATIRKNKPGDIIIIVSDMTRKIANYETILKFLISELVDAGVDEKNIQFVIALGTHRPHIAQENRLLYGKLIDDFNFLPHDCHRDVASIGKTSTGLLVRVNRRVREADFVIATGRVDFHYLAGYSGGRKSILPGIASYGTIRDNHSKLMRNGVWVGQTQNNIIAQEMAEAGEMLGIDYLLNVVETPAGETAQVFMGHHVHAFEKAVLYLASTRRVGISERADCVIVSAGGYPNDKDFYHTHKAMNLAMAALKDNGSIILIGQCAEGFGNAAFMQLMLENNLDTLLNYPEEKIDVGGHRAFLTARILKSHRVYALTDLDPQMLQRINVIPISNITQGIDALKKQHGVDLRTFVVPNGKVILPLLNGSMKISNHSGG